MLLDQFLYQFDNDGLLSQISSDFAGETDYAYDSDGQLTGESSLLVSNRFSYDANGNRVGGGYVVGPGNRLLADGTWSYSYDAEGNLVGKTHLLTGDSWTYSYDHRNQMTLAEKRDASGWWCSTRSTSTTCSATASRSPWTGTATGRTQPW